MRVATVVVVAALLSVVFAQNKCTGLNITMNPGLQPFTTQAGTPSTTLTQACPFGYYLDTTQGGRCITYRQGVSNYMDAPCYKDSDCGNSQLTLGCGANKKCTWAGTRQLDDSCTDNINCRAYTALNGSSIQTYCALKTTNKCAVLTVVTVGVNARCNYTVGNERYMCDDATTCKYFNNQDSVSQAGTYGAGVCTPLRQPGEVCVNTVDITQVKYPNLWCANKQACFGQFSNNRTCVTPRNQGDTCYQFGLPYECASGLYCDGVAKSCQPFVAVNTNCTGDYLSNSPSGGICQMGLRCIVNPTLGYKQCATAAGAGQLCTTNPDITTGNNCTTGLQCIVQTARGINSPTCFAGANGDFCQKYSSGALIDSCQAGLFCQDQVPSNFTCIPKFALGASCNVSNQCLDGTACVNSTCTAFQNEGQICQELRAPQVPGNGDHGLNYLRCNPSLQCSRGICIQNYTKSIGDFCSQDADCENAHCDAFLKRCTRRKLCKDNSACQCACSSGADNMGQCILTTCNKASNALRNCLNPLDYNPFANSSKYVDNFITPMTTDVFYDSGSSYYTKCSSQWSDWMRCRGLMAKWGAPAVPLGDYLLYDLATISASSTVSVSFVAMIAFVLAIALNL